MLFIATTGLDVKCVGESHGVFLFHVCIVLAFDPFSNINVNTDCLIQMPSHTHNS